MAKQYKRVVEDKIDLFGDKDNSGESPTRQKFIEPPFSILDTTSENWQKRRKWWSRLGIKSEVGRSAKLFAATNSSFANEKYGRSKKDEMAEESIFDPALCEVMYNWYCPDGGKILDPFAGGSVRGIVANYLGRKYTGIDIRPEQIASNMEQAIEILDFDNQPDWIVGDSDLVLNTLEGGYDYLFSCPPYADLEKYSDLEGDISNMKYPEFIKFYRSIIVKSCALLKPGANIGWVIGEVRDKKTGVLWGFVPDTINIFREAGMQFFNEAVLKNSAGTAPLRANNIFEKGDGKLVKIHQTVFNFYKTIIYVIVS
jgi:16S rRNA G966 N2-methylase RsmD